MSVNPASFSIAIQSGPFESVFFLADMAAARRLALPAQRATNGSERRDG